MSGNIYIFWKEAADPPGPWTRLTRQGKYVRFTDNVANHLAQIGATTHNHGSMSSCVVNTSPFAIGIEHGDGGAYGFAQTHAHACPSSWSISNNNNDPPFYGLDIIYMNLAVWEANERRFPDGAVIVSNGALTDVGYLTRFTAADGKFISNTTPGATGGSSGNQNHRCQGTIGATTPNMLYGNDFVDYGRTHICASHTHSIDLYSNSVYVEPRALVTRLYEVLALTLSAKAETVAFCNGVPGANWEILTGWTTANLKPGNSNPTLSGSDTHDQSISGNVSSNTGSSGNESLSPAPPWGIVDPYIHLHSTSATLASASHVPASTRLVPMRLLNTLVHNTAPNTPSTPSGPTSLSRNASGTYSATATDPEGNQIYYTFDWGDQQTSNTGWLASGQQGSASHSWVTPGSYNVKVKATDPGGLVSGWSGNLTVNIRPITGGAQLIGLM